jgi:two-component system, chemotaxis family, CheB/CheR fusion protein
MGATERRMNFDLEERSRILESTLDAIGVPFIVTGKDHRLFFFSDEAASLFRLKLSDIGRPLESVHARFRDGRVDEAIDQVLDQDREVDTEVEIESFGRFRQRVQPVDAPEGFAVGAVITYTELSPFRPG